MLILFLFSLYYGFLIECVKFLMVVVFPLFSQHLFLLFQLEKWFSKKKKNEMLELVKNALIAATKFLQKNLPLYSILFKDITYLLPTVRNKDWTMCAIGRVSERFPRVMKEWDVSVIVDEWVFLSTRTDTKRMVSRFSHQKF